VTRGQGLGTRGQENSRKDNAVLLKPTEKIQVDERRDCGCYWYRKEERKSVIFRFIIDCFFVSVYPQIATESREVKG